MMALLCSVPNTEGQVTLARGECQPTEGHCKRPGTSPTGGRAAASALSPAQAAPGGHGGTPGFSCGHSPEPPPVAALRTYFSRRLCSSFLMSASSISESLSLLM